MLGKFSLDTVISFGGQSAGLFLIIYLFTMMVMVMNFFVAILNDFLAAVANSKEMQNRDFEVMDHFLDTVKELVVSKTDNNGFIKTSLVISINTFNRYIKTAEQRTIIVIGTLAVDGWAVTFDTARRGPGVTAAHTGP